MHCERKAWFKATLVIVLLFSLFAVSAMAMPTGTPFMRITNSADGSGYMIVEPGSSPDDGNWIILGGGNAINIPATSFHYIGPETIDYEIGAEYSSLPFFDQLGIGTTYDTANLSLQDFTVPYTTYPVYSENGGKNNVIANFYGSPEWSSDGSAASYHVKLLDLTRVSDQIDFTSLNTIKNTMEQLTLDDIRNSEVRDVELTADVNGDILSIESSFPELSGMTQGYYMLLVVDEIDPIVPCIVAEAPIIVTKNDMSTYLLDAAPKPGDSLTIIEDQMDSDGTYTYVVALIPEASYTTDITMTSDGTVSGTIVRFQGLSLDETVHVTSDGTSDGTMVYIQGLALNEELSKTDMENVTLMKELAMKELNKSNVAFGVRTTTETPTTPSVEIQVPTRTDMPTGKYVVLSAAIDKGTGRIAAINQTYVNLGATWTYHLYTGWNLISVPIVPDQKDLSQFFPSDVLSHITVVWQYDGTQTPDKWWSYYTPHTELYDPGTLVTINEKYGYWVLCDSDVTFDVRGTVPSDSTIVTYPFWNLVGNPTSQERAVGDVYGDAIAVWQFDGSQTPDKWWSYYTSMTDQYDQGTLTTLRPGFGYWVLK